MATSLSLFDLVPGKVLLDRYELRRPLRETGMASTFEAEDRSTAGACELAVFPAGLFEDPQQARTFVERMGAWGELDAPGVPRVRSAHALDDGSVLLASELVHGPSLRERLEEGPLGAEPVLALARRLLAGLARVHAAGLVHGDVKPSSIFLGEGGSDAQLADGGVTSGLWQAKHLGTRTALIGTPYYAPIEQFGGDAPTASSDLYNLGTVLYQALTGVLPWTGRGYIEVFQSKLQPGAPPMAERAPGCTVPPALEAAIAGSLRAKRAERYPDAAAFLAALDGAC